MKKGKLLLTLSLLAMLLSVALLLSGCGEEVTSSYGTISFSTVIRGTAEQFHTHDNSKGIIEAFPEPPEIKGYVFSKWMVGGTKELTLDELIYYSKNGGSMGVEAHYLPKDDTPYTVNHYFELRDSEGYNLGHTERGVGTTDTLIPFTLREEGSYTVKRYELAYDGESFGGISASSAYIGRTGRTVLNIYYDLPKYRVEFAIPKSGMSSYDGQLIQFVKEGASAIAPVYNCKGYRHLGFEGDFSSVTEDLILTPILEIITYTITYELDGGTLPEGYPTEYTVNGIYFDLDALPEPIPKDPSLRFVCWLDENGVEVHKFHRHELGNMTLRAKWESTENESNTYN